MANIYDVKDVLTEADMVRAKQNADVLDIQVGGDDRATWTAPSGETGVSFKHAVRDIYQAGGIKERYDTLADLQGSDWPNGSYAMVSDDVYKNHRGLYIKKAGVWVKSKYDIPDTVIETARVLLEHGEDRRDLLDVFYDSKGNVYRYTDSEGGMYLPGLPHAGSVQDNFTKTATASKHIDADESKILNVLLDDQGTVYGHVDSEGSLTMAGALRSGGGILILGDKNITYPDFIGNAGGSFKPNNNHKRIIDLQIDQQVPFKQMLPIAINEDDGRYITKRMPAGIVTSYGMMGFYHQKIEGYDGDSTGSQFWKYIVDIDDAFNPTLRLKELFLNPETPEGVVKHPHLGRLLNGDLLLVFEQRPTSVGAYVRYYCISTDEGVSWSEPSRLIFNNSEPTYSGALGTVGVITRLSTGRLIIPMYDRDTNVYTIYSDDEGATWSNSRPAVNIRGHEPSVIEDMNHNMLIMDIRPAHGEAQRIRAVSYDYGETWQAPKAGVFEKLDSAPNQGTLFKDEVNGVVVQTHNNTVLNRRDNYCLSVSLDGGFNFPFRYYPFDRAHYGGYSHMLKYAEGVYIIVLEYDDDVYKGVNSYENSGILILNIKEVLQNGTNN